MAATVAGDVLRFTCKMSMSDNDIQNVFHVKISGTSIPADPDIYDAITTWIDTAYATLDDWQWTGLSYDTIHCQNVTQDYFIAEEAWPTLVAGTSAGGSLPVQTSPLVKFGTNTPKSQGRKFLPPSSLATVDVNGSPTTNLLNLLVGWAADFVIGGSPTGWDYDFGNFRPLTNTFIDWVAAYIDDFFATQRRRYFGKGS